MERASRIQVLLIEDDESFLRSLVPLLQREGMTVRPERDSRGGLRAFLEQPFDIILLDLFSPTDEGLPLLEEIRSRSARVPVLMMAAGGSVKTAVEAMKLGASDYLTRPTHPAEIVPHVRRLAKAGCQGDSQSTAGDGRGRYGHVGQSRAIQNLLDEIDVVARTDATVLITGESGTGKDLAARAVHGGSSRADAPFVKIACPLLSDTMTAGDRGIPGAPVALSRPRWADLDGMAEGGTLFLDEVAEIPLSEQARLLSVLKSPAIERAVCAGRDVGVHSVTTWRTSGKRVLCSTSTDLHERVRAGTFREDLYYRLGAVTIHVPPLRDRPSDIPPLAEHFMAIAANDLGKPIAGLAPSCLKLLKAHPWPGNVRQLRNTIERAVMFCQTKTVTVADLGPEFKLDQPRDRDGCPADYDIHGRVREAERSCIMRALAATGGNRTRAAGLLGISRKTLWEKMRALRVNAG